MKKKNHKKVTVSKVVLEEPKKKKDLKKPKKIVDTTKKKNVSKKLIIVIIILVLIAIFCLGFVYKDNIIHKFVNADITSIKLNNYDKETKKITITLNLENNLKFQELSCYISDLDGDNKKYILAENNKCEVELDLKDYYISLMANNRFVTEEYLLSEKINNTLEFVVNDEKIYLAINGTYKIPYTILSIGKEPKIIWSSSDESKVTVNEEGIVTGIKEGSATIIGKDNFNSEIKTEVVVTGLINVPHINNYKPFLPCNAYSVDQAHFLDEILFDKVAAAGKKTRAGVVAAARFLSMEFPYRIGYFLENGRLNPTVGRPYADGEGRFYHEGLYLSTDKFALIEKSVAGPAIWGCKIREFSAEDEKNPIVYRANGLDCSGFVTWALKNGGYDFGDKGSIGWVGNEPDALTWLGDFEYITMDLLKSGRVKAGDLASVAGHVAIVVGVDDNHVYIAEEFYYGVGLSVITFTYQELVDTGLFTHLVLMDKAYQNDGNYTNMW